jgi:glycerate kinase
VITGEGRFDSQSLDGKVPSAVVALAGEAGARVALVAGAIEPYAVPSVGVFAATVALTDLAGGSDAARADAARWLRVAGAELARSAPQFR